MLETLEVAANSIGFGFVYFLIPKEGSIKKTIKNSADKKATEIVARTSVTMDLEFICP